MTDHDYVDAAAIPLSLNSAARSTRRPSHPGARARDAAGKFQFQ